MKKLIALVLGLGILMGLLSGCGQKESAPANDGQATDAAEDTIEISILTRWSTEAPRDVVVRDRIERFQQEHPNIKVEMLMINDEKSFNDKFATGVATGDMPSIFLTYGGAPDAQYAVNGVMLDLTPYMEADPEWSQAIPDGNYNNWRFNDVEGTYGVPVEYGPNSLFYNKDLFAQFGLNPPETIEDMKAAGEVFLENGIVPMSLGAKENYRGGHLFNQLFMKMLGDEAVLALGNHELKYTDPEVVAVFEEIQALEQSGFFGSNILANDGAKEKADFHSGMTAMHFDGDWYLSEATSSEIADSIGVVPFPYYEDIPDLKTHGFGGASVGLSVYGKMSKEETEAAVELVKYLTSEESFQEMQAAGGVTFPIPMELPEDAGTIEKEYAVSGDGITNFRGDVQYYDPVPELTDAARNAIQGLFAGMTPEEVAQQIQDVVDEYDAEQT